MKTPEQLKGAIRNMAKEKKIAAQDILQVFMFERIIERLSKSEYREKFILKGDLLISAMVGIAERTTYGHGYNRKGVANGRSRDTRGSLEYFADTSR